MKSRSNRFSILFTILATACNPAGKEQSVSMDTLALEDRNYDFLKDPKAFTVREDLRSRTFTAIGKKRRLCEVLPKLYIPDTLAAKGSEHHPDYIITTAEILEGRFFNGPDRCVERSILVCTRGNFDEEVYDLFFLAEDKDGEPVARGKLQFEGSQGHRSTELKVSQVGLSVKQNCPLLMVEAETEGGEPDLFREKWVEILIASDKGFRSLFRLQLEETYIHDFEASSDDDDFQNTATKVQHYDILETSSNGLFDIRVSYTKSENGLIVLQGEDVYQFDGQYYKSVE